MVPAPGDVFAAFDELTDTHVVVQVTAADGENVAVVQLDWAGAEPPTADQLGRLRPLVLDYFLKDSAVEHVWVPARVPRRFVHLGTTTPALTGDDAHAHGGWPNGRAIWAQRRWSALPQDLRDRFKAVAHEGPVRALDHPLATEVSTDRPVPGLFDLLRDRPLLQDATLRGHGERVVDLRGSHLTRLVLDTTGVDEIHLNDDLATLALFGASGARVHAKDDGRWLSLIVSGGLPTGLGEVRSLLVRAFDELDVRVLATRFPALTDLTATGGPGYLRNVDALAALPLDNLVLTDVFGYGPADLPDLSGLETLSLTSIPADVAASVANLTGVSIRQPRSAEWLAQNIDNPFRRWDGDGHVPATQAKKAATLYRKARAAALKSPTVPALTAMATAYVEGFEAFDVDTGMREQIMAALGDILDAVAIAPADRDEVLDAAERARNF